jgi:hypothetical protein
VLRDSHFIPAAFYYHLGLDETGTFQSQALQKLTRSRFARVPGQIKKNRLCDECEQRLSDRDRRSFVKATTLSIANMVQSGKIVNDRNACSGPVVRFHSRPQADPGYWSHRQCGAQIVSNLISAERRLKLF